MVLSFVQFMFWIVVVYVVIVIYLYNVKVLEALNESPEMLPDGQLRQIDRYLEALSDEQKLAWSARVLSKVRAINISIAVIVLTALTFVAISQ